MNTLYTVSWLHFLHRETGREKKNADKKPVHHLFQSQRTNERREGGRNWFCACEIVGSKATTCFLKELEVTERLLLEKT